MTGRAVGDFLARAQRAAGVRGEVTVLITGKRAIRRLNRRYRGKDRATDVLSFPPGDTANGFAGDIAVCAEVAAENSRRFGHPTADEIKVLVLHGLLHLAGYDHESDNGTMARKEERLRRRLGLPSALIARGSAPARGARPASRKGPRS